MQDIEYYDKVKEAWTDFVDRDIMPPAGLVRAEVWHSWQRSKTTGLDPYQIEMKYCPAEILKKKQEENQTLIDAVTPIFETLSEDETEFRITLYDSEICLIKVFGAETQASKVWSAPSLPGALRGEEIGGTTAMSLAKETLKPVQLILAEHYDVRNHQCVGTCVPILSPAGKFLGAITFIEGFSPDCKQRLSIMKAFGKAIEYNLQLQTKYEYIIKRSGWNAGFTFDSILGQSPAIRETVDLARRTADIPSNTLIYGESGSGKEMFAQSIHNCSLFRKGPFVAVNCAALPPTLIESELFGYETGSFTGAKKAGQAGKFELANGGTIFLDEIDSLPLEMQAKLLRVVQEKSIARVGSTVQTSLNLKIIAACNRNLEQMVQQNTFRADLFFRLNVITITVPPLRERAGDTALLAREFLRRKQVVSTLRPIVFTDDALALLARYNWPGNVRELENLVERAFVQASLLGRTEIDALLIESLPKMTEQVADIPLPQPLPQGEGGINIPYHEGVGIADSEKDRIYTVFKENRWNISRTAQALGIARNTLYKRLSYYGILEARA
ncbi:MAG: sigma 54-interacting transcriptional regulator [Spirochaetaceae bacterium]|jgi:transcriptional regulator with PAS, ATPase and Fis domain|nr:sigma 54-interacting transcriptional regulator [Spirochaetaceae bacterium]